MEPPSFQSQNSGGSRKRSKNSDSGQNFNQNNGFGQNNGFSGQNNGFSGQNQFNNQHERNILHIAPI